MDNQPPSYPPIAAGSSGSLGQFPAQPGQAVTTEQKTANSGAMSSFLKHKAAGPVGTSMNQPAYNANMAANAETITNAINKKPSKKLQNYMLKSKGPVTPIKTQQATNSQLHTFADLGDDAPEDKLYDTQDQEIMHLQLEIAPLMREMAIVKEARAKYTETKWKVDEKQSYINKLKFNFQSANESKEIELNSIKSRINDSKDNQNAASDIFTVQSQLAEIQKQCDEYTTQGSATQKEIDKCQEWLTFRKNELAKVTAQLHFSRKEIGDTKYELQKHPEKVGKYGIEIEDKTTRLEVLNKQFQQLDSQQKYLEVELKAVQRDNYNAVQQNDKSYEQLENTYQQKEKEEQLLEILSADTKSLRFRVKELILANESLQSVLKNQYIYQDDLDRLVRDYDEEVNSSLLFRNLDHQLTLMQLHRQAEREEQSNRQPGDDDDGLDVVKEIEDTKVAIHVFDMYIHQLNGQLSMVHTQSNETELINEKNKKILSDLENLPKLIDIGKTELVTCDAELEAARNQVEEYEAHGIFAEHHETSMALEHKKNLHHDLLSAHDDHLKHLDSLHEVYKNVDEDSENLQKDFHFKEHELNDLKQEDEFSQMKLEKRQKMHASLASDMKEINLDITEESDLIKHAEHYKDMVDTMILVAKNRLDELKLDYPKELEAAKAELLKLAKLYPKEFAVEKIKIDGVEHIRRKFPDGEEPPGYYDHVEILDKDNVYAQGQEEADEQEDFDIDTMIKEKRDSEKAIRRGRPRNEKTNGMFSIEEKTENQTEDQSDEDRREEQKQTQIMLQKPNMFDLPKKGQQGQKSNQPMFGQSRRSTLNQGAFATQGGYQPADTLTRNRAQGGQGPAGTIGGSSGLKDTTGQGVLEDLLICLFSRKKMLTITCDHDVLTGYAHFMHVLKQDANCHEALFGLGQLNFAQGRYEYAEKLFIKAYHLARDLTYRLWLGYCYYYMFRICAKENPQREKLLSSAARTLEKCLTSKDTGLYAAFCMLYISCDVKEQRIIFTQSDPNSSKVSSTATVTILEPKDYVQIIAKSYTRPDKYEYKLASAIVMLRDRQQHDAAVNNLHDLIDLDQSRSEAYFVLTAFHLQQREHHEALVIAEEAYHSRDKWCTFHEQLMATIQYARSLNANLEEARTREVLLTLYYQQPNYNTILYYYGKFNCFGNTMISAINALQFVFETSCQVRKAKAAFWLSKAFSGINQALTTYYGFIFNTEIQQVFKIGDLNLKKLATFVCPLQARIMKALAEVKILKTPFQRPTRKELCSPVAIMDGQNIVIPDDGQYLLQLVHQIEDPKILDMYKAVILYSFKKEFEKANLLFLKLMTNDPTDVLVYYYDLEFIRFSLKSGNPPVRNTKPEAQLDKVVDLLRKQNRSINLFAQAQISAAKLCFYLGMNSKVETEKVRLVQKAIMLLLVMKNMRPIVDFDNQINVIPEIMVKFFDHEFDHLDFQKEVQQVKTSFYEFGVQKQDVSAKQKYTSFASTKTLQDLKANCPLAAIQICDIDIRDESNHTIFIGAQQGELAHLAAENTVAKKQKLPLKKSPAVFFRSSTPLIAVIHYFEVVRQNSQPGVKVDIDCETIDDNGFALMRDASHFLLVATFCYKAELYYDLAIFSLHMYLQTIAYYQYHHSTYMEKRWRALCLLALILLKQTPDVTDEDKQKIKAALLYIEKPLQQANDKADACKKKTGKLDEEGYLLEKVNKMYKEIQTHF